MILVPFSYLGYIGWQSGQIYEDAASFSHDCKPDLATFVTANYTRLAEMAYTYDQLFEDNHLPLNFTVDCKYVDGNYTDIDHYSYSDNGALYTGFSMAGYVGKYLAGIREQNASLQADALRVIKKMVSGMAMLVIVPNGGLGSEYGGILARGWAGPDYKLLHPGIFDENIRHFNGTGDYSQYRWRGYTSNDEFGGYYLGLAMALKYVPDAFVQHTVHQIIDQVANYMLETNFLGINGPGGPTGVNQKPTFGTNGFWIPLLLKMASIAYPEKYEAIYLHYVAAEMLYLSNSEGGDQEVVSNYYAYAFGYAVVLGFLIIEDKGTPIWKEFYDGYMDSMRYFTEYHRNAFFNIAHLIISSLPGNEPIIERDIEDQLMRFDVNHFPDRGLGFLPLPDNVSYVETLDEWVEFFETHPYGSLYRALAPDIQFSTKFVTRPLTVDYKRTGIFYWGDNPFAAGSWSADDELFEWPGVSFTNPYWLGRGFGFISPSGVREI